MKITFRLINREEFKIETNPTETMKQLKQNIEKVKGYVIESQKLVYAGRILDDQTTVSELKIDDKKFIILMISTPTKKAKEQINAPSPATAQVPEANAVGSETQPEEKVDHLLKMGFKKEEAVAALKASSNDLDLAVDYLINGLDVSQNGVKQQIAPVPKKASANRNMQSEDEEDDDENEENQPHAQQFQPVMPPATDMVIDAMVTDLTNMGFDKEKVIAAMKVTSYNYNAALDRLIENKTESPQQPNVHVPKTVPNVGQSQNKEDAEALERLRVHPMFINLHTLVKENPDLLPDILRQIGQTNPEMVQAIERNEAKFHEMLSEPLKAQDDGTTPNPSTNVSNRSLNDREREAIDRLAAMGFPEEQAREAYLACDKNEELTVSLLLEQGKEAN